eukprot:SAG31_NODE_109_length_24587_cov_111.480848_12_plen_232_part_00
MQILGPSSLHHTISCSLHSQTMPFFSMYMYVAIPYGRRDFVESHIVGAAMRMVPQLRATVCMSCARSRASNPCSCRRAHRSCSSSMAVARRRPAGRGRASTGSCGWAWPVGLSEHGAEPRPARGYGVPATSMWSWLTLGLCLESVTAHGSLIFPPPRNAIDSTVPPWSTRGTFPTTGSDPPLACNCVNGSHGCWPGQSCFWFSQGKRHWYRAYPILQPVRGGLFNGLDFWS